MENLKEGEPPPCPTAPPCDCCQFDLIILLMIDGYGVREAIAEAVEWPDWIASLAA